MEFPYTGWILQPSFKPVEVKFIEEYGLFLKRPEFHVSESGKVFHTSGIYKTKSEAISSGYELLEKQQAALEKKQANLNKRKAVLDKHAV